VQGLDIFGNTAIPLAIFEVASEMAENPKAANGQVGT
jgi:hypothetical protein